MGNRAIGTAEVLDATLPPDTVYTMQLTGGSSAQALDWISSAGSAAANAAAAGVGIIRITCLSTAGAEMGMFVNLFTTAANVGAAGSSYGSSGISHPVFGRRNNFFQVPGGSTGFSIASYTSGNAYVEQWRK